MDAPGRAGANLYAREAGGDGLGEGGQKVMGERGEAGQEREEAEKEVDVYAEPQMEEADMMERWKAEVRKPSPSEVDTSSDAVGLLGESEVCGECDGVEWTGLPWLSSVAARGACSSLSLRTCLNGFGEERVRKWLRGGEPRRNLGTEYKNGSFW